MNMDQEIIKTINEVINGFFKENAEVHIVPAKELMPAFIKAGIFAKDFKSGKPIRDILKELDRNEELDLIPYVHPERNAASTYWYFIPDKDNAPTELYNPLEVSAVREAAKQSRLDNDESYILDLCDTVLEQKAERNKRFNFLLGDLHKDGVTRTLLPVDAYYPAFSLVIELKDTDIKAIGEGWDKSNPKTISGVGREKQREMYNERRAIELPKHGFQLIDITLDSFKRDKENKIVRNLEKDLAKIKEVLKDVLPTLE